MGTDNLNQQEIAVLLIMERLIRTHSPVNCASIAGIAEIKLPNLAQDVNLIVDDLQKKGLLLVEDELRLTGSGEICLQTCNQGYSLNVFFYDAYYQAVLTSRAHAEFCERAYGKNLSQHGTADMAQLDILLDELALTPGMSLLDFGCGDGRISEYIADLKQTYVTGIDIAPGAIELARQRTESKRDRMHFYNADLEHGELPEGTFDRIITIDSIFFTRDQKTVLERLLSMLKRGGKMGIFYISPPQVPPAIEAAFKDLGLRYQVRDLSKQNHEHWIKKRAILEELEPLFYEEGNGFLFKNRMAECDSGLENFQRHLFIIEVP
jgi:ubiquinone/menaquinone biosynthesis C-methylase UbiE